MSRTAVYSALILRSRPSGESNRELWLLCAGAGLVRATVFGGPKSKLRAHAAPFHSGQAWIYHDPVRDSRKLSDFDVGSWRPGLRERYERAMAADAAAETILASHGGGGHWEEALALAESALDALESADGELCERLLAHFLWRWSGILGIQPDMECCAGCGKAALRDEPLWYSAREGGILCANCSGAEDSAALLRINPGCRRWLAVAGALEPALTSRYTMDAKSFRELKALTTTVLAEALGKRLASWDML
jgi:DNA repair protein RecO (recombination protein O)